MKGFKADFGNWLVHCDPGDGARIGALRYSGFDLLTSSPENFTPPVRFYGEYETRPVYGYDDCFPTVDPCSYPGGISGCRDHGELCWQPWSAELSENSLICSTGCYQPRVSFKRILSFDRNKLTWRFEVSSLSQESSVFIHVMHALLPLDKISQMELPVAREVFDEIRSRNSGLRSQTEVGEHLLAFQPGSFCMLLLKDIAKGLVKLKYTNGLTLEIAFDQKLFPTLGVWWNNNGYPEGGQLRSECAFEPIPGTCSDLSKSFSDGVCLSVEPGKPKVWEITWKVFQEKEV